MSTDWRSEINNYLTVDLHCDALSAVKDGRVLAEGRKGGHFDLPRMEKGGLWVQVLSIFVHPEWIPRSLWWKKVGEQVNRLHTALESSDRWRLALSPGDVDENYRNGIRSLILEIEGLHPIEDDPDLLEKLWNFGVRIYTLTWNNSNRFAHSAKEYQDRGLTDDGREIVREIDSLGGIVDLSHSSDRTFFEVVNMGIVPMLSHSCVREIKNSTRNATRLMIEALGESGGVMGVNFFPGFLSSKSYGDVTSEDVVAHIERIIEYAGPEVPALGSDFDGVKRLPADIPDVASFWRVAQSLEEKGFDEDSIAGILGENFMDYWEAVIG
ncbi:membrane dipeptidase [bacterium]|nr:membrane dipeptidase [bacterium]